MRRLLLIAFVSGTLAGLVWFAIQLIFVVPLIERAEEYEAKPHHEATAPAHESHDDESKWHPARGWQQNAFTAAATVLTGIGLSFVLFGAVAAARQQLTAMRGALWGLAGFACFTVAPALGLPPQPPGMPHADLTDRQIWWITTVVLTAAGLYLITGATSRVTLSRLGGAVLIAAPHLMGAPAATGVSTVPKELVMQFIAASIAGAGLFWVVLGFIGGYLVQHFGGELHQRSRPLS